LPDKEPAALAVQVTMVPTGAGDAIEVENDTDRAAAASAVDVLPIATASSKMTHAPEITFGLFLTGVSPTYRVAIAAICIYPIADKEFRTVTRAMSYVSQIADRPLMGK